MAKVLQHCSVVVVGAQDPELIRRAHMEAVETIDDALALVAARCGPEADLLIVPHATLTLPVITSSRQSSGRQSSVASEKCRVVSGDGTGGIETRRGRGRGSARDGAYLGEWAGRPDVGAYCIRPLRHTFRGGL
jgi:hypothetical protein